MIVRKASYNDFKKRVNVERGQTVEITATLTGQMGLLKVEAFEEKDGKKLPVLGAEVLLNEEVLGMTPFKKKMRIGDYAIQARKGDAISDKAFIILKEGKTLKQKLILKSLSLGKLIIESEPENLEVIIMPPDSPSFKTKLPMTLDKAMFGTYVVRHKKEQRIIFFREEKNNPHMIHFLENSTDTTRDYHAIGLLSLSFTINPITVLKPNQWTCGLFYYADYEKINGVQIAVLNVATNVKTANGVFIGAVNSLYSNVNGLLIGGFNIISGKFQGLALGGIILAPHNKGWPWSLGLMVGTGD